MRQRFHAKLHEQVRFLERSCQTYDTGDEAEGFRIAIALRVIFHDSKGSTSLLTHLQMRDGQMLSSSRKHRDYRDYIGYRINLASPTPVRAFPTLRNAFHPISINQWWRHEVVFVHQGAEYQRRNIILSAANKDGGAHVDAELEAYYETLSTGKFALGITGDLQYHGPAPFQQGVTQWAPNSHVALIRQFAHETLASVKRYEWLTMR